MTPSTPEGPAATRDEELEAMTASRDLWRKALCEVLQLVPSHFEEIENVRLGQSPGGDPEKDQHPKGEWVVWDSEYPEDGSVSLNVMASPPHIAQIKADEELGARLVEVERELGQARKECLETAEEEIESTRAAIAAESRASAAAVELEELREAWCMNVCDAPWPEDERRPLHTPECRKAKAALAVLATPAALVPKDAATPKAIAGEHKEKGSDG